MSSSAVAISKSPQLGGGVSAGQFPALVLNADYAPLSYAPLSLWSWQDSIQAVFREVVTVLNVYDQMVSSPSVQMNLPSVIVLNKYVPRAPKRGHKPAFTRRNVYLRDRFCCQYCNSRAPIDQLTYDHVMPRAQGGPTTWENVVTACKTCNLRKGDRLLSTLSDMHLAAPPHRPSWGELYRNGKKFPPKHLHADWLEYF